MSSRTDNQQRGAVDATAMTMLEISPRAPDFRPFSGALFAGSTIMTTLPPMSKSASTAVHDYFKTWGHYYTFDDDAHRDVVEASPRVNETTALTACRVTYSAHHFADVALLLRRCEPIPSPTSGRVMGTLNSPRAWSD